MANNLMSETQLVHDNLLVSDVMPVVRTMGTVKGGASGTVLVRGQVVALTTAGDIVPVNGSASDETKNPYGIVADSVSVVANATEKVPVYLTGQFNGRLLVFGESDTLATFKQPLRNIGIFAEQTQQ